MKSSKRSSATTLGRYLRDIATVPLLTESEERKLARKLREQGDTRAGHRLIEANLRFVAKVAFEYRFYGLPVTDLIQEGNLGLMKAVQKFDPERGVRLTSYAVWWIRAYIQIHVLTSWSLVELGTTQAQRRLFFSLARATRELERLAPGSGLELGVDPASLATLLNVRAGDVVDVALRVEGRDVSLDMPLGDGTSTLHDVFASRGEEQDTAFVLAEETALIQQHVSAALGQLDPRERYVVISRVLADEKATLREIGRHLGFSRERARQIERRALAKLRRLLEQLARDLMIDESSGPEERPVE